MTTPNSDCKASKKEIIHEITGEILDVIHRNHHSCQLGEPLPGIGGDNADHGGVGHEIEDAIAENGGVLEIDVNAENGGAIPTEVRLFGQAIGHVIMTPSPVGTGSPEAVKVAEVVPPKTSTERAGPSEIPAVTDAGEVTAVSGVHLFGQLIGNVVKTPTPVGTGSTETVKVAEIVPAEVVPPKTSFERAGPSEIPAVTDAGEVTAVSGVHLFGQLIGHVVKTPTPVGTGSTETVKVAEIVPAKTSIERAGPSEIRAVTDAGEVTPVPAKSGVHLFGQLIGHVLKTPAPVGNGSTETVKVAAVNTKTAIEIRAPSKKLATMISDTCKVAAGTTKTAIEIEGPREIPLAGNNTPAPDGAASTVEPADSVNVVSGGSDPVKVTDVVAGETVIAHSEEMIPNTVMAATQFSLHGQMGMMAANVASGSVNGVESADNEREMTAS